MLGKDVYSGDVVWGSLPRGGVSGCLGEVPRTLSGSTSATPSPVGSTTPVPPLVRTPRRRRSREVGPSRSHPGPPPPAPVASSCPGLPRGPPPRSRCRARSVGGPLLRLPVSCPGPGVGRRDVGDDGRSPRPVPRTLSPCPSS